MSLDKKNLVVVLENIRSAHNVGSILRTCEVFGVGLVYCCGITPYPPENGDERLPHVQQKAMSQITKTALGAEKLVSTLHFNSIVDALQELRKANFNIYGIEQAFGSSQIEGFNPENPFAIVLGNEVQGLSDNALNLCDKVLEITQFGKKESLNVSVAAGIALYELSH